MTIRDFLLLSDENLHPDLVLWLRKEGFDVKDVKEEKMQGESDRILLMQAQKEGRVMITHDADFGKMVFTEKTLFIGIIYLRPGHFNPVFHQQSIQAILNLQLDIRPPFLLIAENTLHKIKIRLRNDIS